MSVWVSCWGSCWSTTRYFYVSASTAFHALELGFRTVLIEDCSRGIDKKNIAETYEKIESWHGLVVQSGEVKNMVLGRDRRPELGYKLALEFRNNFTYPAKNKNSKYNGEFVNPDGSLPKTNDKQKV